jgi:integrase/recombinase XerD
LEKVLIWTFLDTGLRLSELASLRAAMIDWDNQIMLVHGKGGPYGLRSKLRVVPLTPRVAAVLREHFRHADTIGEMVTHSCASSTPRLMRYIVAI